MASRAIIELPADIAARLDERVASGASSDAVEAIREGLSALDAEDARRMEAVRAKVAAALSDPAPSVPAEISFDRAIAFLKSLPRK